MRASLSLPLRSILLVSDEDRPGTLRSVAEDLYARALESALDDALRMLRPVAAGGAGAAPEAELPTEPALAPLLAPVASSALLRAVLSEEDSTA